MTADYQSSDEKPATHFRPGIWLLLLAILLIRLPFWPSVRMLRDGIAYSIGALVTHVAHPPGSVGYCLLGGWLNQLIGNVETTFIDINLVAGLVGTYFSYRLSLTARLSPAGALLAAASYGLSLNTLTAALTIAPHLLEGVGTILAAWLGLLAIQRQHRGFALGGTLTVALIGSFRPTATAFLIPLWLYSIYFSEALPIQRRIPMLALHLSCFMVITGTWSFANEYYMTRAGYGGTTYEKQVLTPAPYDYVSMNTDVKATGGGHTFHLPAAEMLAWFEPRLHVRLLPHIPDWPTPSLSRAIRLSIQQAAKQATFLVVSMPALLVIALLGLAERIVGRRYLRWRSMDRTTWILLICWITPAALFFVFGHLGTLTYLQNDLGALAVGCAALLGPNGRSVINGGTKPIDVENDGTNPRRISHEISGTKLRRWLTFWPAVLCVAGGALIFAFGRPIATANAKLNLLNVVLLEYTGPSKAAGYSGSRIGAVLNADHAAVATDRDYLSVHGDRELVEAARRNHFEYLNPVASAQATPPRSE